MVYEYSHAISKDLFVELNTDSKVMWKVTYNSHGHSL